MCSIRPTRPGPHNIPFYFFFFFFTACVIRRMESSVSSKSKRHLLFDRRYGWVIDEWKDPSDGGRGMFCILPLTKAALKMASQSISLAASSAIKAFEKPELVSPQQLHASLNDQFHKMTSTLPKADLNLILKGNLSKAASSSSSSEQLESSNPQMV